MESFVSFSSPSFGNSPGSKPEVHSQNLSEENTFTANLMVTGAKSDGFIGVLQVYIHQARDIHNICIYQNQDVYAKLCLTSNPDSTVSTRIINGGGRNPIFNEKLQLNVQQIDASLKCEVWMLSRAKNYLEDQLLGFALVPISAVAAANGTLTQEFSLSSTDLFHSPAGFVQLSLCYSGFSPDVIVTAVSSQPPVTADETLLDSEVNNCISTDYSKLEFPDPQVVNENERMVSEYFEMAKNNLDSESSKSFENSNNKNHMVPDISNQAVDSVSSNLDSQTMKGHSSPQSGLMSGTHVQDHVKLPTDAHKNTKGDEENNSASGLPKNDIVQPVININLEPEQPVMQQQIVDLYMKSMQEFTESLAKMKLPMDVEVSGDSPDSVDSVAGKKLEASKSTGSRVFYGSRAFF